MSHFQNLIVKIWVLENLEFAVCHYMLFGYFCICVIIICNDFYVMEQLQNGKKISSTIKISYCVLSRCACSKLILFLSAANFMKWILALKDTWKTSQCKKYRKLWTVECVRFAQGWEVVLLIDPNDIHKNIMLEITSY